MFERLQPQSNNSEIALVIAKHIAALIVTVVAYVAIAMLVHALGLTPFAYQDNQYRYTQTLVPEGPGFLMIPAIAAFFGWLTRRPWSVALAMILPLPFAMAREMSLNSTSHNLFPFEIIGWAIPFGIAFVAAWLGRWIRTATLSVDLG
jgi:hypothetical protein